jgi:UDP-GlcNAc:undecaprenyl-phosphate GlcNAc-1-phosphate transferase
MIDVLFEEFKQLSFIFSALLMFCMYYITITFWPIFMSKLRLKKYDGIQRIHDGEVPRIGGLISVVGIFIYYLMNSNRNSLPYLDALFISSIPLLIISIKEDFFHNTKAIERLLVMFFSCFLFFYLYNINFPLIQTQYLNSFLPDSQIFNWLFFGFCAVIIMNGNNLIDGANGLMPMSVIMQSCSLIYICVLKQDLDHMIYFTYLLLPMIIFLIYNYPYGKVFMGDLGAYFFGFNLSLLTISIFGEHPELPVWLAVVILFYPAMELLFSIIRRLYEGKNLMQPDSYHLHFKIFYFLKTKIVKSHLANGLVMPSLILLWAMPFILLTRFHESQKLAIISLITMVFIYLFFYWVFPRDKLNKF